jgi:pimeloyl-ACP methyl ester carboxylesterase
MVKRAPSRLETIEVRGLRYRIRHWGDEAAPPLVLLHGWADASATFQFVADELAPRWHVLAPDWRGCGGSQRMGQAYTLLELVLDLEVMLKSWFGGRPASVVGHSMGGNVASLLAGAGTGSIGALVMLDAFGTPRDTPDWQYDQIVEAVARGAGPHEPWRYASRQALAERLARANPRLDADKAGFLAAELGAVQPDGSVHLDLDPAWRDFYSQRIMPCELFEACWRRIEAPVLLLSGAESHILRLVRGQAPDALSRRLAGMRRLRQQTLAGAGHNLHHDDPAQVASLIEAFLQEVDQAARRDRST